jgi:lactate permease
MAVVICIFMMGFTTRFFGPRKSWKEGFAVTPFCLLASVCFLVPYFPLAWIFGPEMPSLVGGVVGLLLTMFLASKGVCMPKGEPWTFGDQQKWPKEWTGQIAVSTKAAEAKMSQIRAWLPYVLIAIILILTRVDYVPGFPKTWMNNTLVLKFNNIMGYAGISDSSIKFLYLPGTIPFILVALCCSFIQNMSGDQVKSAWVGTIKKMKAPAITLCASVALVTIFKNSGGAAVKAALGEEFLLSLPDYLYYDSGTHQNLTDVAAAVAGGFLPMTIPLSIATAISGVPNAIVPFISYWIGALGAFITGSNTVSDQMFGQFQWDFAGLKGLPTIVILAIQGAGGAGGNMICINNIVAATAVTGMANREGEIFKKTIIPCVVYSIGIWIIGLILIGIGFNNLPAGVPTTLTTH